MTTPSEDPAPPPVATPTAARPVPPGWTDSRPAMPAEAVEDLDDNDNLPDFPALEYLTSGAVKVAVGDRQIRVPRPRMGAFREFRIRFQEDLAVASERTAPIVAKMRPIDARIAEVNARRMTPRRRALRIEALENLPNRSAREEDELARLAAADAAGEPSDEERDALADELVALQRDRTRLVFEQDDALSDVAASWWVEVIARLTMIRVDPDDLDAALASTDGVKNVLDFWMTVPPPPGG